MASQSARPQRAWDRQMASRRSSSPPAGGPSPAPASGRGDGVQNRTRARDGGALSRSLAAYRASTAARPSRVLRRLRLPMETARAPAAAPAEAGAASAAHRGGGGGRARGGGQA